MIIGKNNVKSSLVISLLAFETDLVRAQLSQVRTNPEQTPT